MEQNTNQSGPYDSIFMVMLVDDGAVLIGTFQNFQPYGNNDSKRARQEVTH